jgi:hypothetical protein
MHRGSEAAVRGPAPQRTTSASDSPLAGARSRLTDNGRRGNYPSSSPAAGDARALLKASPSADAVYIGTSALMAPASEVSRCCRGAAVAASLYDGKMQRQARIDMAARLLATSRIVVAEMKWPFGSRQKRALSELDRGTLWRDGTWPNSPASLCRHPRRSEEQGGYGPGTRPPPAEQPWQQ